MPTTAYTRTILFLRSRRHVIYDPARLMESLRGVDSQTSARFRSFHTGRTDGAGEFFSPSQKEPLIGCNETGRSHHANSRTATQYDDGVHITFRLIRFCILRYLGEY